MEYQQLLKEYQQAVNNFNNADADYIETAILKLKAAECKLNILIREIKGGF